MNIPRVAACLSAMMTFGTAAHSATITANEAKRVAALWEQANRYGVDIQQTISSIPQTGDSIIAITCLSTLSGVAGHLDAFLSDVTIALMIDSSMVDARDDAAAVNIAKGTLAKMNDIMELNRSMANHAVGSCQRDAAVAVKAQALLDFMKDVERQIAPIARKIGAP